jgi:hypothetical protein
VAGVQIVVRAERRRKWTVEERMVLLAEVAAKRRRTMTRPAIWRRRRANRCNLRRHTRFVADDRDRPAGGSAFACPLFRCPLFRCPLFRMLCRVLHAMKRAALSGWRPTPRSSSPVACWTCTSGQAGSGISSIERAGVPRRAGLASSRACLFETDAAQHRVLSCTLAECLRRMRKNDGVAAHVDCLETDQYITVHTLDVLGWDRIPFAT